MKKKLIAALLALACLAPALSACSSSAKKVTIGSMYFTENKLLAEMEAQLIEKNTDIAVERKFNMDGSPICFQALKSGQIDIYPEYTGTALMTLLKLPVDPDPDSVYKTVHDEFEKQFQLSWLQPLGFNNTYAVAVTQQYAEQNNLKSVSDLVPLSKDLVFGGEHQFFDRNDGYDGLLETYGLTFKETSKMDVSLKYQALSQDKIQATDAFTTDGQLKALNLVCLEDDKHFFPPYYAAPIVRDDALSKYPELGDVMNKLGGQIDETTMQELNYKVDNEKQSIESVATDFLKSKGLIS